jgi:hypothetical protein
MNLQNGKIHNLIDHGLPNYESYEKWTFKCNPYEELRNILNEGGAFSQDQVMMNLMNLS